MLFNNRAMYVYFLNKMSPLTSYLPLVNVQDALQRQLLKIEPVALVEVGADRLGVVVHHHCVLAHLSEGTDTGHGTPVELHAASCYTGESRTEPVFTQPDKRVHSSA